MKNRICQILGALMLGALGHYAFQALMSSKQEHVAPAVVSQKIEKGHSSEGEEKYITITANATAGFKPRSEVSQSNNNQTSVTPSSSK